MYPSANLSEILQIFDSDFSPDLILQKEDRVRKYHLNLSNYDKEILVEGLCELEEERVPELIFFLLHSLGPSPILSKETQEKLAIRTKTMNLQEAAGIFFCIPVSFVFDSLCMIHENENYKIWIKEQKPLFI